MAPEQIDDSQKADIRSDIYSLGCTLYFLLSGHSPFPGMRVRDLFVAHRSMDARLLNHKRPDVPPELAALVAKMMAKDPAERFQEPAEVALALTPFFKQRGPSVQAASDNSPSGPETVAGFASADLDPPVAELFAGVAPPSAAWTTPDAQQPEGSWSRLIVLDGAEESGDISGHGGPLSLSYNRPGSRVHSRPP